LLETRCVSIKKNAVAATNAIEISQNEIPTKSSDRKFLELSAAKAIVGKATKAAVPSAVRDLLETTFIFFTPLKFITHVLSGLINIPYL
jgi:hypothetical protein